MSLADLHDSVHISWHMSRCCNGGLGKLSRHFMAATAVSGIKPGGEFAHQLTYTDKQQRVHTFLCSLYLTPVTKDHCFTQDDAQD